MNKLLSLSLWASLILFIAAVSSSAAAKETPTWWERAEALASREGYRLINVDDLMVLYESKKEVLIVDVRPKYEYRDGHLPGAVQLEFDLSERLSIKPAKRLQFEKTLGPDKNRAIVIYCRNYS